MRQCQEDIASFASDIAKTPLDQHNPCLQKAQATQLPTFGALKKYETRMQNRRRLSTKNSYR